VGRIEYHVLSLVSTWLYRPVHYPVYKRLFQNKKYI
jgi:hypothetical protein